MDCYYEPGAVAIVTGSSSGLGKAAAIRMAQKGLSKFCLSGRNKAALEETKLECLAVSNEKTAVDILIFPGDLTDESVCQGLVDAVVMKFGRIDILSNNAGIGTYGAMDELRMSDYDEVMNVNLRSHVVLTRLCVPHLRKTKGCIVNNSSIASTVPLLNYGYYCMTKAALDMYTMCLALEESPNGVRVNSVNAGVVDTGIHVRGGMHPETVKAVMDAIGEKVPLRRTGKPQEVANLIAFLASKEASYMTGSLTPVGGGIQIASVL